MPPQWSLREDKSHNNALMKMKNVESLSVKQLLTATDGRMINHRTFFYAMSWISEVSYLQLLCLGTVSKQASPLWTLCPG